MLLNANFSFDVRSQMLAHVFRASQFCSFVMASKFSRGIFRIHLNGDQQEIIKFAAEGHNLLITGQAGVGKSEVVKSHFCKHDLTRF